MTQQPIHPPVLEVATDYPHWVKELADAEANGLRLLAALKASQGIEPLLNELSDCLPDERRALERECKAIRKQVEAAITKAQRYEARTAEG